MKRSGVMTPARPLAASAGLERKDDSGNGGAGTSEVKQAVDELMGAFEEFKSTNDERLAQIEAKGTADPLTEEKLKKINGRLDDFEGLSNRMAEAEKKAKAMDDIEDRFDRMETMLKRSGRGGDENKSRAPVWAKAVANAIVIGEMNLSEDERKAIADINAEFKALNVGNDTAGGYLAPVEYVREIIKGVTELSPARGLVRVRNTANKAMQIPKRTGQFAAKRVHEMGTKTPTEGLTYGLEELVAPEMFALIDVTNDMLEDSAWDIAQEIETEATEQFAVKEGAEFVSGTGVNELEGILTNGDIQETNSGAATAVTGDGLIQLKYGVKSAYAANGTFILNRSTLATVRTLKDGNGQYIWMPGLAQGRPNSIDGDPYQEFPDMPNEAAGTFPVAYGDFRRGYTMLDRIAMEMLRDPYTQATGGQVRFIFRKRTGGKVTLAEAMRKLKCST